MDHTATGAKACPSQPLRLVLQDDELTEQRLAARLPWSKGASAPRGSRLEEIEAHHLALLLSAARRQRHGEAFCGADEVRLAYLALCEQFERQPKSRATVYRMLRNLEAKGYVEIVVRGSGRPSMVFVMDAAHVARKAREEGNAGAKPRTTVKLRAAFEAWDNEHNVCLVLEGLPGECDQIEALWNIAREAVERLEQQGA